jgi:hypothetical protein
VKIEDTVRGFKEIVEGKHDDLPEQAFPEQAEKMAAGAAAFYMVEARSSEVLARQRTSAFSPATRR